MAEPQNELTLAHLPSEEHADYFKLLVKNCIKAYGRTYSDSIALDFNGVIGKMRVMVLDDDTYKKETKMLKARKFVDDLGEVDRITREMNFPDDEISEDEGLMAPSLPSEEIQLEEMPEEEAAPDEPAEEIDPFDDDTFDIRNKDKKPPKLPPPPKSPRPQKPVVITKVVEKTKKPTKGWDKDKITLQLKALQLKNEMLAEGSNEEEKEGDALNIFFVPVSREEFEAMKNVEISASTLEDESAFKEDDNMMVKKIMKRELNKTGNEGNERRTHMEDGVEVEDL